MAEGKELKPWDELPFEELGANVQLAYACEEVGWKTPTKIQMEFIPAALKGKDIIGLGQTGPGKIEAFAIPILQAFLKNPHAYFACVLCPTRELAIQVAERFEAFGGENFGTRCAVLVEGVDGVDEFVQQSKVLGRRPHIVVATPGRLVDHLCDTNVFSLRMLKFLVLDEADKLLNDHSDLVDEILNVIPPELRIYLFSETMTQKVKNLQGALLKDPVMINAASKYNLRQQVQEAKGISEMKIKEGGRKKRTKCDEDDARNRQASKKKHHPGPQPRPLTTLGKKLKDKLEELSRRASPKKMCEEVHGDGSISYKLVYRDGVTVRVYVCGDDSDDEEDDEEDDKEDDEEEEWDTTTLTPGALPPSPYDPSYVEPPMFRD